MRIRNYYHCFKGIIFLSAVILASCAGSNSKFKQEYARVWKETIKSDAWKASLVDRSDTDLQEDQNFYTSNEEVVLDAETITGGKAGINEKYKNLVADAYFKIIAEAEKSDRRLKNEYERLTQQGNQGTSSKLNKNELVLAAKKYEAHNAMLNGLKSWNIMSEYGSDDLEFFQAEHRKKVVAMISASQSEEAIINYLVYKLADLYHFEQ
ncbi:hypothetical protein [Muriicola sp. Z0-33]|uniref:hypothetical protein n=1 Tax=Muriicola sp. Z0-33 TaxID=2816957 RepID=UPI0022378AB6|nr:hypothetical protein [Muriicola sp. Z0-33]MCW5514786.1 hypothetical protein [Muriicola sp. Z0-33]